MTRIAMAFGVAGVAMAATAGHAATARRADGGVLKDGSQVEVITLSNANGVSARILSYGATLQSLIGPDAKGKQADVILGHDTAQDYEAKQDFFGVTVGRYANRIAQGRFAIDGTTYQLPTNNGVNSLHGGGNGFDRANWQVVSVKSGAVASVVLRHISPDGASGYPGEVTATVTYSLDTKSNLGIVFAATTTKPTIINMTNHALFNVAGDCARHGAMAQRLTIPARRYTPVDETLIPTGELKSVKDTVFDFTKGRVLADGLRDGGDPQIRIGRGYDHNWVLDKGLTAQPKLVARVEDLASGRVLEVLSTEPGLQMYTGNFLDGTNVGKRGCVYRMGDGFVLEPQKFPDTPNRPAFGSARLDPGHPYRHAMIYHLTIRK
jgi:aldose 1-epimerase